MTYRKNEKMNMYLSSEGRRKAVNGEQQPHDENHGDDDDDHDDVLIFWWFGWWRWYEKIQT